MRALLVVVALLATGCTAPAPVAQEPALHLLAIDGRWPFDAARAEAFVSRAGLPAPVGAVVLVEARGAGRVLDVLGVDAAAARAFGLPPPAPGEAVARAGLVVEGATLDLAATAFPTPYVATYFEMERTPPCARRAEAKLCFLPELEKGEARLRLRVDEGARDAALLPDLVEVGPRGRPAYWNGSFEGPEGESSPFVAIASLEGEIVPAEFHGLMRAGDWIVRFRLEANGTLAAAGAAGIVRVREPGYLWFDDRLQGVTGAPEQARAVLANATATRAQARVTLVADALPWSVDVVLPLEDARSLAGTEEVTGVLVNATRAQVSQLEAGRRGDGFTQAIRARVPEERDGDREQGGAIVFAAPPDVEVGALPGVPGAGAPALALATRPPVGETPRIEGTPAGAGLLLLAHADGPTPWGLPEGGRWTRAEDALENLSRSRTLALGSPDIVAAAIATLRVDIGEGNTTRSLVTIGGVRDGPSNVLWTSAALASGAARPANARVVLPLEAGADRGAVVRAAVAAWGPLGLVLDR